MCIIINKPKGIVFPEKDIIASRNYNTHGFGMVYYDPVLDTIKQRKSINYTEKEVIQMFKDTEAYDALYHFRIRTKGATTNKQCHPFRILNKENHGIDMFFAHNGTITGLKEKDSEESDTMALNRLILKPILKKNPNMINIDAFHELLMRYIGTGSKLVFFYGKGESLILNSDAGAERAGCWVSNEFPFNTTNYKNTTGSKVDFSNTYPYNQNNYSRDKSFDEVVVNGMRVKKNGIVWVFKDDDKDYWCEGVVTQVSSYSIGIRFTKKGDKVAYDVYFNTKDGKSWRDDYTFITEDAAQTEDKTTTTKETTLNEIADSTVIQLPFTPSTEKEKEDQKKIPEIFKEREKKMEKTPETTPQQTTNTTLTKCTDTTTIQESGSDTDKIKYGDFEVPNYNQYGAYFVEPDCEYGGVTIEDVHLMTRREKLEYFVDNPEDAFNMFVDLVDYINLEDSNFNEIVDFDGLDKYVEVDKAS